VIPETGPIDPLKFTALALAVPLVGLAGPARAETSPLAALQQLGYENLVVQPEPRGLTVWYENRRRRLEIDALGEVLRVASAGLGPDQVLTVLPERDRVPLLRVRTRVGDLRDFLSGRLDTKGFGDRLEITPPPGDAPAPQANSSRFIPRLSLSPGYFFSVSFNGFVDGTLDVPLGTGLSGSTNERLSLYPFGPATWTFAELEGHRWLTSNLLGAWSAGRLWDGTYGAQAEVAGQLGGGDWVWRIHGGAFNNLPVIAFTSLERRFFPLDVVFVGGVGVFENGDRAIYLRAIRWFGRSQIESAVYRSDLGIQLRMGLTIDLGPDPLPTGPVRIVPGTFDNQYRVTKPAAATLPFPSVDTDRVLGRLSPSYVRAHVEEWRHPER
jgi:hypothetical protein